MNPVTKPLAFFNPLLSPLMRVIAKQTRFRARPGLTELLEQNPRLVVVFNHASPLSWLPAISLLTAHVCAKGGAERKPMGVMDRFFYSVPGLRAVAHQLTQSDHPMGFEELVAKFRTSQGSDIVIFPEGSNCFFGDPFEVQPFRSPRFVELAVRTSTPILLCAHRGSEVWAQAVAVPGELHSLLDFLPAVVRHFLSDRIKETGLLTIPKIPSRLEHFEMLCELYVPILKESELSSNKEVASEQIRVEANLVHTKLQKMLAEIDAGKIEGSKTAKLET